MAGLAGATFAVLLAVVGPAAPSAKGAASTAASPAAKAPRSDVDEARRLYSIGEKAMAAGKPTDAVALWRRAIVLLPATAAYDDLRHRLLIRLGHGLMVATQQTRDIAWAEDAAGMLERYVTRHEQIFGDGEAAEQQRGEVYELLYEVESLIEQGPGAPPPVVQTYVAPAHVDEGAPDGMARDVVVPSNRKLARTSVDDPKIRAKLTSRATNAETGLVFTKLGKRYIHPARGLVRMEGLVRPTRRTLDAVAHRELQAQVRAAFVSVRPALRRCFDEAYARTPTALVPTEAELVLEPDGSVSSAEIVGAQVVDADGTKCVRERLADGQIAELGPDTRVRVRVPLVFFWQPAVAAGDGDSGGGSNVPRVPRPGAQPAWTMGPIEGYDFASTRTQPTTW